MRGIKNIRLSHPSKVVNGTVQLTGSKSESNRALVIQALSKDKIAIENLSEAADTITMQKALKDAELGATKGGYTTIDVGPAGTAMRFLTSYLTLLPAQFKLTGSERMQERPVQILVEALTELGADITYAKNTGFPPLLIRGGFEQRQSEVAIKGSVSSQYLSSLLLIAPALPKGLTLRIEGQLTSKPYVTMTLNMLQEAGIKHDWNDEKISILPQPFSQATIYVEPDWSAASYWLAIVALSDGGEITLPGLKAESLQGDIEIVDIMKYFGVESSFTTNGLLIRKTSDCPEKTLFDFKECPDLAQTVIVVAAAMRREVSFKGLETLKIKETDRIAALQNEIGKFGCRLIEDGGTYHLDTSGFFEPDKLSIRTYEDHRMAMAFAPLALVFDEVTIEEPHVVEKSYPDFWKHLEQQGFLID